MFIDRRSNHPPLITKKLPSSVDKRISHLSSNKEAFSKSAPLYEAALKRSNYQTNLHYSPTSCTKPKTRTRKVIWFNPPFGSNVRTNVSKTFLNLIDKHFPATNTLHKIFNRNSVKVSYSCMDNCKSIISKHNFSILSKQKKTTKPATNNNPNNRLTPPTNVPPSSGNRNCRNSNKCPLNKNCLVKGVVFKAEVEDEKGEIKDYIGMTSSTFKTRWANHKTSFQDEKYAKSTELSKHIWRLKKLKRKFKIKWSILKEASPYRNGAKNCNLCLQEKLHILKGDKKRLLNMRCELFSKCRHRKRYLAGKFERAHAVFSRKQCNELACQIYRNR